MESAEKYKEWHRVLDEDEYYVRLSWEGQGELSRRDKHKFLLSFTNTSEPLSFSIAFNEDRFSEELPAAEETAELSADYWTSFWSKGGAIDLSESSDPRAHELERRIVLSQYLMAIQSSDSLPPQKTGLIYDSWYGKYKI